MLAEDEKGMINMLMNQIGMILLGVLCGSLLFGSFLPQKLKKVDVTQLSSDHNPGTANAMKYAGVPVGILCLLGDILKGTIPVSAALHMGLVTGSLFPLIMAAPVMGHAYSLFHRGKGGKAIAVSFGVMIGLLPVHYELLVLLCCLYLVCSLVIVVKPHTRRTRITFLIFGIGSIVLLLLRQIPLQLCCGALLIAGIVIHKNNARQEAMERENSASLEIL